ncbi:MAG: UDP-N-acetylglucosamine 1-carboxyvinyltransferase [Deltaproteobacteria bacterium]|nr:MAG: UDP-N-acetylglucosamine 1-carboxyvinyltransferase [Deltaproteobacteria bacterium]PIE73121.1 MAG: UDP-N-acetylglucosamine 1-carboxyvinyltransferase [Deltaproteobacteria bacterium]
MEKLVIVGGKPLCGEVRVSGAKNAALPLMAASLLVPGIHQLSNVPDLRDTRTFLRLLGHLGVQSRREGDILSLDTRELTCAEAPYELVKTMRASVLVLGPLLARLGRARVSLPGGCAIGARPIDFHIEGLKRLGVAWELEDGYVKGSCASGLTGQSVYFDVPSVTGTENLLMAAVLAEGTTVLKNVAKEPEIGNLVDMLCAMGARIEGRGTDKLVITGGRPLSPARCAVIPDRIEAGTYLIAIAATGGQGTVTHCRPDHLPSLLEKLRAAGVRVTETADSISVAWADPAHIQINGVDIQTMPYPGYPTDLQAQFMAFMSQCSGSSLVKETIFENRFMHVPELRRMGACIHINGTSARIDGVKRGSLRGAQVMATDLRASSSLVIAGLSAQGTTEISRVYHLERGYENLVEKLSQLGAEIRKEPV